MPVDLLCVMAEQPGEGVVHLAQMTVVPAEREELDLSTPGSGQTLPRFRGRLGAHWERFFEYSFSSVTATPALVIRSGLTSGYSVAGVKPSSSSARSSSSTCSKPIVQSGNSGPATSASNRSRRLACRSSPPIRAYVVASAAGSPSRTWRKLWLL